MFNVKEPGSEYCPLQRASNRLYMSSTFLEIVELPDGRIVLRRSDEEVPMVTLSFSGEAREFLRDRYVDVARIMFHAGLEAAGQLMSDETALLEAEADDQGVVRTLH